MDQKDKLYSYPPNFKNCDAHRFATRIFKGINSNNNTIQCDCCGRKVGVKEVQKEFFYSRLKLAFLGPGVPLFLTYLINCLLLLLFLTLVFVIFSLYSNIIGRNCTQNNDCVENFWNMVSIINKKNVNSLMSIQNYIVLAFTVLTIPLYHYFRYKFRQIQEVCDNYVDTPSDYAIIIRRLVSGITKRDIEEMIQKQRSMLNDSEKNETDNLAVQNIILSYDLGEFTRIKESNMNDFKELISKISSQESKQSIAQKIKQFKPKPLPKLTQTASIAVIIFSKQESKKYFSYNPIFYQKLLHCIWTPCLPLSDFRVKQKRVSIQRAPEPDDIVWRNAKISMAGSICRKTIYGVMGGLLLLAGGGAQYGFALIQTKIVNQTHKQLMKIASSILILLLNFIILQFIYYTTQRERNQTLTEYNTVLTVKISLFQFLNSGIFVIIANLLANYTNFRIQGTLSSQITIIMLMNALTTNLILFILSYFDLKGNVKRWLIRSSYIKVTQLEANSQWEKPQAEIPSKYAYIIKTIWLTALFAPFVPIIVLISFFGLLINYFIEKFLYARVYSAPNMLSSAINDSAIELLEYFPVILCLGELLIYFYFYHFNITIIPYNWSIPILISLAISVLQLILPMDEFNKWLFELPIDSMHFPSYQKVEQKFEVTYEMNNPAYECNRKRRRDTFMIKQLFGQHGNGIQLANFMAGNQEKQINQPLLENLSFLPIVKQENEQTPKLNVKTKYKSIKPDTLAEQYKNASQLSDPFKIIMKQDNQTQRQNINLVPPNINMSNQMQTETIHNSKIIGNQQAYNFGQAFFNNQNNI